MGALLRSTKLQSTKTIKAPEGAFIVLEPVARLLGAQYCKTFFEAVNTTTYVQHFLLTSIERVAS